MQFLFLERKILQQTMLSHSQSQNEQQPIPSIKTVDQAFSLIEQPLPKFPWGQRWLKGHEYGLMLQKMVQYCQRFGLARCKSNEHPLQIYDHPQNGMIYFMEGHSLQQFGFPRIQKRKIYRWKKMNFTTDLPKHNPIVTYLVASSVTNNLHSSQSTNEFRMHIGSHILCHIKKVSTDKDDPQNPPKKELSIAQCFLPASINFYRLFAYIHNNHWIQK